MFADDGRVGSRDVGGLFAEKLVKLFIEFVRFGG